MIHPWLLPLWHQVLALGERLPHAILITGAPGLGKRDFAESLAARLLCASSAVSTAVSHVHTGEACGHCTACKWFAAGTHPDFKRIVPDSEVDADAAEDTPAESPEDKEGSTKEKSRQIRIEQIRAVFDALTVTATTEGGHSVVIIDPAEAMNAVTANALLKLLEEPPERCTLVLVSSAPRQLLPTIRSRCQQWPVPRPSQSEYENWRATAGGVSETLLAVTGGLPLAAKRLADKGFEPFLERFIKDIATSSIDPLGLAAQWENWLKKDKTTRKVGFHLGILVDWMQRWASDIASLRLGGRVRYFPSQAARLGVLSSRMTPLSAGTCHSEFINFRRAASHPLNLRLFLEDMLTRYARLVR